MLRDIFATSMGGTFRTTVDNALIDHGEWSYQGYGNAEIAMKATGSVAETGVSYSLRFHSAEFQIDSIGYRAEWSEEGNPVVQELDAEIVGLDVKIRTRRGQESFEGDLTVPDQTVYDGPSPIWMIHLMLSDLPPDGRQITAPAAIFDPHTGGLVGGFFKFERTGLEVSVRRMDEEANVIDHVTILLADDGCPRQIRAEQRVTEIIRVPREG